jgi:antitoxin component YwqK of YwqJK toxin-antitoxin module
MAASSEGKLNGRFFQKLEDGKEIVFEYVNNKREGLHQVFYPEQEIVGKVVAMEVNYHNDLPEGDAVEYNNYGQKISVTPYKDGLKKWVS